MFHLNILFLCSFFLHLCTNISCWFVNVPKISVYCNPVWYCSHFAFTQSKVKEGGIEQWIWEWLISGYNHMEPIKPQQERVDRIG